MNEPLVRLRSVRKSFGPVKALDGIDLDIDPGTIVGLIGENGCGKSTLLKAIAGLAELDSGTISIGGNPVGVQSKTITSYLPDRSALPTRTTVGEACRVRRAMFPDFDSERALDIVRAFGLHENHRLQQLSKGQQEKVQIALVMARRARLFLLDEPISGVDPLSREETLRVVIGALEPESALVITTHMVHDVEMLVDRAVLLRHGRICDDVAPEELRETTGEDLVERLRKVYA